MLHEPAGRDPCYGAQLQLRPVGGPGTGVADDCCIDGLLDQRIFREGDREDQRAGRRSPVVHPPDVTERARAGE